MRTLGKRVGSQGSREFESRPLRHFYFDCSVVGNIVRGFREEPVLGALPAED